MEQRLKEITAAVDLILDELERVRPATCQDAVEVNWRIRKLAIARGLIFDSMGEKRRSAPRFSAFPAQGGRGISSLQRLARVE